MAQSSWFGSSVVPFRMVFLMWAAYYVQFTFGWPLNFFGVRPWTLAGLIGVFTAPLLHADLNHLLSNTIPLLFLGTVLFFFYERIGGIVFFRSYFWTNAMVYIFGRSSNHIGASGLVYGLAFFLILFGILRRDLTSLMISIVVIIMYGGVIYGVLPTNPELSWESHLAGALVGIYTAVELRNKKNVD